MSVYWLRAGLLADVEGVVNMADEVAPDLSLDDAYWESLLTDVEAQASERGVEEKSASASVTAVSPVDLEGLWQAAQQALECAETIRVRSTGCNRGGLLIDWQGLHGFIPASHLTDMASHLDEDARRGELMRRVGQTLDAKVIEIDRGQSRFVVSEKMACTDHDRRDALLAELAEGQVRTGTVTNVCTFGAFVELGGLEGLLHISEISWGRVNHPRDLLKVGQTVRVLVMSVDRDQHRVALSMKRLKPDPWASVEERYEVGQLVDGVVTSVVAFGAFTRLEDGLEGLIHVSELAEGNFLHPRNVVCEGQSVRVRVLNIDGAHRRLGLSLRQADSDGVARGDVVD